MGSLSDSPIMGCLAFLGLVALLSCGIQGASLPYGNGFEWHYNQMGVHLDLALKDQVNPLVGGKAHVELPISAVWKLLEDGATEVDKTLLKPLISGLEKSTLGRIYDVETVKALFVGLEESTLGRIYDVETVKALIVALEKSSHGTVYDVETVKALIVALEKNTVGRVYDIETVKADITFNAEKVLEGIFNVAVDYTLVHRDGTEEKASTLLQGKVESGEHVISLNITPKTTVMIPNQIFFPLQMLFTCDWPSAHTLTINGNFGKIFFNIANNMNEVSVRGVWEKLGHQYKYSTVLSLKEKFITFTFQDPTEQPYNVVMKLKMLNGFPMIEITGNVPACRLFSAGYFKTEVMVKNWFNYEFKHILNGAEMMNMRIAITNGKIEITGNVPACLLFAAGESKTEVIVKNWFNYELMHIFNGMEMLNLRIKMLNGFPIIEIAGNVPACLLFSAGQFKTEVMMKNWFNYEIKHIFNGMEMFGLRIKMLNGFPMIEIAGSVPACRLFAAGQFKTEVMVKNWFNYVIKHIFNGMEMLNLRIAIINGKIEMIAQYGLTHKTHMVIEYEYLKWMKIIFPLTNTWLSQEMGVHMHYQPTNEAKLLEGGNMKIVLMRDNVAIINIGGYYGLTLDSTKYELLLNDSYVSMLNQEIVQIFGITFSELKFYGKLFLDLEKMNGFVPRLSLEAKLHKDEMKIFHYLFTTTETPYKLHIFCPYVFKNVLNIQNIERIEITHEHVLLGKETSITTMCNLTTKKIITKLSPNMMSIELFDGEVSVVKYISELTKVMRGPKSLVLEGKQGIQFNWLEEPWFLPKSLCFHEMMKHYHFEVDMAAGKVNIKVMVTKDTTEILSVVVNNMQAPYIISLNVPVLALEMRIDYELSTKIANVMINNKSFMQVKPTLANEVEVAMNEIPLFRLALITKGLKITTIAQTVPVIVKTIPAIKATVTWKTFSLFQNTFGLEILDGKIAHKTIFGWNINMLRKAFVDIKMIGSGTELFGDYEVLHHMNWNILGLRNIDVEWNSKVLSTGVTVFKIPMVAQGKLLLKNFVFDLEIVEKLMDVTYTQIFKTKPLTVVLPFFHYP